MSLENEKKEIYPSHHLLFYLANTHPNEIRQLKKRGLFETGWTNIARHQLHTAAVAYALGTLLELDKEIIEEVVSVLLTHDQDKRWQIENLSEDQIIEQEHYRSGETAATGSSFDMKNWTDKERLIRLTDDYCDGIIIGTIEDKANHQRANKQKEHNYGKPFFGGKGTWDVWEEIGKEIERGFYTRIIEKWPSLIEKYSTQEHLLFMVGDFFKAFDQRNKSHYNMAKI